MIHWLSLILGPAIAGTAIPPRDRALDLQIAEQGDRVTIELHANSSRAQHVSFAIEVTGSSNSKHSGSLTLAANDPQTLSTLKVTTNGNWCAKVVVEEEDRAPYELREGPCTG